MSTIVSTTTTSDYGGYNLSDSEFYVFFLIVLFVLLLIVLNRMFMRYSNVQTATPVNIGSNYERPVYVTPVIGFSGGFGGGARTSTTTTVVSTAPASSPQISQTRSRTPRMSSRR
jgi:hypothetical protein